MPSISSGLPPPRLGYSSLNQNDGESSPSPDAAGDSLVPEGETTDVVRTEAWPYLAWSFLSSIVLTVSVSTDSLTNTEIGVLSS